MSEKRPDIQAAKVEQAVHLQVFGRSPT